MKPVESPPAGCQTVELRRFSVEAASIFYCNEVFCLIWSVGGAVGVFLTRMEMLPDIWKLLQIFLEEPLNISAAG